MFGLTLWQIGIVIVIGFLVFGIGGSKKLFRRAGDRVKDTGSGIKGAAQELQASFGEEADENSAVYRTTKAGREKASEGATIALDAAKEARSELANLVDDARAGATGADPQTAIGRAARSVSASAQDMRAAVGAGSDQHEPQTALGKATKTAGETAKAHVGLLGEAATEFRAGVEGTPVVESATAAAALPAAAGPDPEDAPAPDGPIYEVHRKDGDQHGEAPAAPAAANETAAPLETAAPPETEAPAAPAAANETEAPPETASPPETAAPAETAAPTAPAAAKESPASEQA